jgi:hypothetical protein
MLMRLNVSVCHTFQLDARYTQGHIPSLCPWTHRLHERYLYNMQMRLFQFVIPFN